MTMMNNDHHNDDDHSSMNMEIKIITMNTFIYIYKRYSWFMDFKLYLMYL